MRTNKLGGYLWCSWRERERERELREKERERIERERKRERERIDRVSRGYFPLTYGEWIIPKNLINWNQLYSSSSLSRVLRLSPSDSASLILSQFRKFAKRAQGFPAMAKALGLFVPDVSMGAPTRAAAPRKGALILPQKLQCSLTADQNPSKPLPFAHHHHHRASKFDCLIPKVVSSLIKFYLHFPKEPVFLFGRFGWFQKCLVWIRNITTPRTISHIFSNFGANIRFC